MAKQYYHVEDPLTFYNLDNMGLHKELDGSWSPVIFYSNSDTGQSYSTYPERWEERFFLVGQA
jgi:hypothetical protein